MRLPSASALLRARMVVGALGLFLTVPAIPVALSLGTGGPLDPLGSEARTLARGLDQMDAALTDVQSSLASAETSLQGAERSLADGSSVSDSLSAAMADLATASEVQVLGLQPFAGLVPRFQDISSRAESLASSLKTTGQSVQASRAQLHDLQAQVSRLTATFRDLGAGAAVREGIGGASMVLARFLLAALLAWLAAVAGIWLVDAIPSVR